MALTNMHSDLRFNPGIFSCTCMAVKFFAIPTIYFTSWGVTTVESVHESAFGGTGNSYVISEHSQGCGIADNIPTFNKYMEQVMSRFQDGISLLESL